VLKLSRETIERCQKTEYALVSSLQRDPVLADRTKRLRKVPDVGPISALTWALEIGDVSRFRTIKQAISYCGLCGDERSSADMAMRMPLSKQRNKHIQRALVEAAKLAQYLVAPNIASLNRLSEILNKADVLAEEIAKIINNIGSEGEKPQALGEASKVACRPLLIDRPHASASRTRVPRKPKPQGKPAAPEV
jgi:hypothetical protein